MYTWRRARCNQHDTNEYVGIHDTGHGIVCMYTWHKGHGVVCSIHDIYMTRPSIHDTNEYAFIHDAGHGAIKMTQMNMHLYMTQGTVQSICRYPGHHEELYHIRFNASGVQVCVCVYLCVYKWFNAYIYIQTYTFWCIHVCKNSCIYTHTHLHTRQIVMCTRVYPRYIHAHAIFSLSYSLTPSLSLTHIRARTHILSLSFFLFLVSSVTLFLSLSLSLSHTLQHPHAHAPMHTHTCTHTQTQDKEDEEVLALSALRCLPTGVCA